MNPQSKALQYMKVALAAAIGFACAPAQGQSNVLVYGRLVAGLDYSTHVSSDGVTSASRLSASSNQWVTSKIGIKGTEALGGDLKAIFHLQSGFGLPTGTLNSDALFNRYAYVGLESDNAGTYGVANRTSV